MADEVTTEDKSPEHLSKEMDSTPGAAAMKLSDSSSWKLTVENYLSQTKIWPQSGQHILAHFDETSIVVYQAFKDSIAEFAVKNQRFGGPFYNFDRMSWIKTNFMWMMYRCGWAQKGNQERVLAVRLNRTGFDEILLKAYTMKEQKSKKLEKKEVEVRLQWDPDHDPTGEKLTRRAVQLGLKGKTLLDYANKYIVSIKDITDYVHEQYQILQKEGEHAIATPRERIYTPSDKTICQHIELDDCKEQTMASL